MTTIKNTYKTAAKHCKSNIELERDIRKLGRQSKMNAKQRRDCVIRWAMKQRKSITKDAAKKWDSSVETAYAVLIELINASPTGDFCHIKQETIATRMDRSLRTIQRAIYTLRECGLIYTKHNYKTTDLGNKRTVSYTLIGAFRKHYNRMKQYLESINGIAPVGKIIEMLTGHSQRVTTARLLDSFNKTAQEKQFIDTKTGEILDGKQAKFEFLHEVNFKMGGV